MFHHRNVIMRMEGNQHYSNKHEVWQLNKETGVKKSYIVNKLTTDLYRLQNSPFPYLYTAANVPFNVQGNAVSYH